MASGPRSVYHNENNTQAGGPCGTEFPSLAGRGLGLRRGAWAGRAMQAPGAPRTQPPRPAPHPGLRSLPGK